MATKSKKSTIRKKVKAKKVVAANKAKKKIATKKKPKLATTKIKKAVKINKKAPVKKLAPTKKKLVTKKVIAKKPAVKKVKPVVKVMKKVKVTKAANNARLHVVAPLTGEQILPYQEKPGEDYMNEKQQQHFRHILQQRKQQILEEMDRTMHHLQDEAANFPDPNDRATQEEEFSLELRARDRERKFIKNIDDAIQKLSEGEYGYCETCGVEIGIRRLEARPTATLCIDCKTLAEMREKHISS